MTGCILTMCMFNLWVNCIALKDGYPGNSSAVSASRVFSGDYQPFYLPETETLKVDDGVMAAEVSMGGPQAYFVIQLPVTKAGWITALLYYPTDAGGDTAIDLIPLDWCVWDDDGADGYPGTLLASGTKADLAYLTWNSVDVSSYNINIDPGYVYVGWKGSPQEDSSYWNGLDAQRDGHLYYYDGSSWMLADQWWLWGDLMIRAVLQTTDVAEGEASKPISFRVYPNPSDGLVSFVLSGVDKGMLSIYDPSGRRVIETEFFSTKSVILDPGLYFYRASAGNQTFLGKLMIR
ncbi:MAG: T9SS type A sorting domain-containing protein [candidate division WOR-3 bacterium]